MWKYLLISLLIFFPDRCSEDDAQRQEINCVGVPCTQFFVIIGIEVRDDDGVKVPLDSFEVTDKITAATIGGDYSEEEMEIFRDIGAYPIYNDSYVQEHPNENRSIVFKGFIDGNMVVTAPYVVRADCCHVSLFSGDEVLIIN
jgi:hypothetical protein